MKTDFRKSFARDLKKLKKNREVLGRIKDKIEEVEAAESLRQLPSLKKLSSRDDFYRIRVGDYRMGVVMRGETVEFVRCLHRREIYRYFP